MPRSSHALRSRLTVNSVVPDVALPHGFPVWVRYCHFFNFLFVTLLIRSGLSILADHPRLHFNNLDRGPSSLSGSRTC
jgi:hypothetical protein